MTFPIYQGLFQYDLMDHFAILGVSIDAEQEEIRERYLKIAYKLHPDTCRTHTPDEKEQAHWPNELITLWTMQNIRAS